MATNKRDLKAYARFDGTGRIVPGSLVLRRTKPKNGNWKEIQTYECCDGGGCDLPPVTLTASGFTTDSIIGCTPYIRFFCNGEQPILEINTNFLCIAVPGFDNMVQFYDVVAQCFSWMGTWSLNGTIATLEMNGNLANLMCPDGVLTMQANTGCPA